MRVRLQLPQADVGAFHEAAPRSAVLDGQRREVTVGGYGTPPEAFTEVAAALDAMLPE
jgi:hypothetical protein